MLSSSSLSADTAALIREGLYVNGEWIDGEAAPVDVHDPASGELLASVASASSAQVEQAVAAAQIAFQSWSKLLAKERAAILRNSRSSSGSMAC